MQNYVTYKKFPDAQEARALQHFLIGNGIECLFIDDSPSMGSAMAGDYGKQYEVQLKPEQFEAADKLLEEYATSMLTDLPEDYYLLSFSDEELHDVVVKHDEWSEFDYVLARKLLAERGKGIDEDELKTLRQHRIENLAKPEKRQKGWVIAGYIMAFLGGLGGIITGYVLWTSTKTLPNGQVVPTYSEADRKHGKSIVIFGAIMLPVMFCIKIFLFA
ncbi:hypothetical protein HYN59_09615 [Flavobacterium album]|uniref:DUF2007 domain-containing protein n=1 Tax=Flavobacterium album TaxID=2175091 RepID=A0A2S1QY93_9FLAO|nr:hypothetical protein [Flavobacterium album]AWH85355.1 hypothetical protein HYN59_09615 [Flavobacterium album]